MKAGIILAVLLIGIAITACSPAAEPRSVYLQTAYGVLNCSSYELRSCGIYANDCVVVSSTTSKEDYACMLNVRVINLTGG